MAQQFHFWSCTTEKLLQGSVWLQVWGCRWGLLDPTLDDGWVKQSGSKSHSNSSAGTSETSTQSGSDFTELPCGLCSLWVPYEVKVKMERGNHHGPWVGYWQEVKSACTWTGATWLPWVICFCGLWASLATKSYIANCGPTKEQEGNWGEKDWFHH